MLGRRAPSIRLSGKGEHVRLDAAELSFLERMAVDRDRQIVRGVDEGLGVGAQLPRDCRPGRATDARRGAEVHIVDDRKEQRLVGRQGAVVGDSRGATEVAGQPIVAR
jgi:hypothetical protein